MFLVFLVFAIVLPVWVYSDAQQNSPQSEVLWALVAFFGGILGLLLYFLIGRDTTHRPQGSTSF
jgi:RsiW-degrading membrane proteinase PrsW (M82 family)